ncbi:DUF262 domain-containing protein [Pseudomonas rhodesiae]|uniref:DUF262 domain-containing protein n=1 Tax=Pseudomonas rhodesiae TaxID=76760 RepID=UPI00241DD181|nr:DUF262 domain-containing HNH endonuclease family protein [Pseudomonas rhodesiae]
MQPSKTTVLGLFSTPHQYQIPIFQRGYVWTLGTQVGPLWTDIQEQAQALLEYAEQKERGGDPRSLQKHFLGSIVLTPVRNSFGRVPAFEVIDGQQRSTTLQLLLLAFRQASLKLDTKNIHKMLDRYVQNSDPYMRVEDAYKVWPTQAGQGEMRYLNTPVASIEDLCARYPARDGRKRLERPLMIQAYLYLYHACLGFMRNVDLSEELPDDTAKTIGDSLIEDIERNNLVASLGEGQALDPARAEALYMTLNDQIQIMTLTLEPEDDPQIIFETLNARGEPLLASDLIRNFVFLEAAREDKPVPELYEKYWSFFDVASGSNGNGANTYWREKERLGRLANPRIDLFFYNYTILRSQDGVLTSHVFQAFKAWWQRKPGQLEDELKRMVTATAHFQDLVTPVGTGYVAEFARLIKSLDVGTVAPVYLAIRERLGADSENLKHALGDLASYLTRRAVCGLSSKSYGHFFLRVLKAVTEAPADPHLALRQVLLDATAPSEVWPDDLVFETSWRNCQAYTSLRPAKTCGILRALEYAARGPQQLNDLVPEQGALTVEHVMPQSWVNNGSHQSTSSLLSLSTALHSFGNLTLLTQPLNSRVSDGPFADFTDESGVYRLGKRSELGLGGLLMNTYFHKTGLTEWDEAAIACRGQSLLRAAKLVFPRPVGAMATPEKVAAALSGY